VDGGGAIGVVVGAVVAIGTDKNAAFFNRKRPAFWRAFKLKMNEMGRLSIAKPKAKTTPSSPSPSRQKAGLTGHTSSFSNSFF
jgi:hypothetical protein